MDLKSTGEPIKNFHKGFSIIEIMVVISVCSIFIAIISTNLPGMIKLSKRFVEQTNFEGEWMIFLIRFEKDFYQADLITQGQIDRIANLCFEHDFNNDSDYSDSREKICYRWSKAKSRLERKSGKGYFQGELEGVNFFSWKRQEENTNCYQLSMSSLFKGRKKELKFCHNL